MESLRDCLLNEDYNDYYAKYSREGAGRKIGDKDIEKFEFEYKSKPGGNVDAAGRALLPGDIVAFMRRTGTGGMVLGRVTSIKKRVSILTEFDRIVTMDGSQCCLVMRNGQMVE